MRVNRDRIYLRDWSDIPILLLSIHESVDRNQVFPFHPLTRIKNFYNKRWNTISNRVHPIIINFSIKFHKRFGLTKSPDQTISREIYPMLAAFHHFHIFNISRLTICISNTHSSLKLVSTWRHEWRSLIEVESNLVIFPRCRNYSPMAGA